MFPPRHSTTLLRLCDGDGPEADPHLRDLLDSFEEVYGPGDVWVVRVPARICVAGDHLDYWPRPLSEVRTFASREHAMFAVISPREDEKVKIFSTEEFGPCEFNLPTNQEFTSWPEWLQTKPTPPAHWANYVAGAIHRVGFDTELQHGFEMFISSDIPVASGASSSSALTLCGMLAALLSNGIEFTPELLMKSASQAEWYCGTRGGMQDHATMVLGIEGEVLKLKFDPFESASLPWPDSLSRHRLISIFTHPSEKSDRVKLAFNARAFVARELAPCLIDFDEQRGWSDDVISSLPEEMHMDAVGVRFPRQVSRARSLYPGLFAAEDIVLRPKDWIRFAIHQSRRVAAFTELIETNANPALFGALMNEEWHDAGELYQNRTPQMEAVANRLLGIPGVEGVKVMGAGFGGNLLALVHEDRVEAVFDVFQKQPELLTKGAGESILIHSPGDSLQILEGESLMPDIDRVTEIAAVLLCGGVGSRMKDGGIDTHKPLLPLNGVPSTEIVVRNLAESGLEFDEVIIVVPPGREREYEGALMAFDVTVVTQKNALGTGDAVYGVLSHLGGNVRHLFVSFGTQPLVRARTIRSGLSHHIQRDMGFTLCTTWCENPYAPLIRDESGRVSESLETHLNQAEMPEFGETNVGGYWADVAVTRKILEGLHTDLFDTFEQRYRTQSGELGFPNEMVDACLANNIPVDGAPYADPDELMGLKSPEHIEVIERRLKKRQMFS